MTGFFNNLIYSFIISFGALVGASIFSGVGAVINDHPPLKTMLDIAGSVKVWAIAIALGGTFTSFEVIDRGLLHGEIRSLLKQAAYVLMAVIGANAGMNFIRLLYRCGELWKE
jgi:hypothetical protein